MISNFTTNIVCCKSKSKLVIQSWHHWMTIVNNKHEMEAFLFYAYWQYPIVSHVSWGGDLLNPRMQTPLDAEPPWMQTYLLDADPSPWMHTTPWGRPPGGRPPLEADPPGFRPPGHVTCDACWEATPSSPWTEWQTLVKILPCPELRKLRAVNILRFYEWPWKKKRRIWSEAHLLPVSVFTHTKSSGRFY